VPLAEILPLQLLLGPLDQRPVENPRFRQADVLEALAQLFLVESLQPDELDRGDGRTLFDEHHQNPAVDLEPDVLEEAGAEQFLDGIRRLLVGHGVADLDRQIAEHRAGFRALDAFDSNVRDREWIECECGRCQEGRDQACDRLLLHGVSQKSGG